MISDKHYSNTLFSYCNTTIHKKNIYIRTNYPNRNKKESDIITKKILAILALLVTILLTISGCIENNTPPIDGKNTIYVGGSNADYRTIQQAIDAAQDNATIIVNKGIYNESININKTITLVGEDKNTTIINFNPNVSINQIPILTINANNCTIENLQITIGNGLIIAQGISINTKNNTIKNTIITNVTDGIDLTAYAESNTIIQNQITHNRIGINGINSLSNTISYNTFSQNTQYCIYFSSEANHNTISFNRLDSSAYGIRIKGSTQNYVYNNCIINNTKTGMYFCCGARENHFYNNTLINNTLNADENSGLRNVWDNVQGESGNYWDDYNGSDENRDGIGDIPYTIPGAGNQDSYPLMTPPLNFPCSL